MNPNAMGFLQSLFTSGQESNAAIDFMVYSSTTRSTDSR
jgi:hypothetical protein